MCKARPTVNPPTDANCYLLRCRVTAEQLLIDAGGGAERLLTLVGPAGLATVVVTHADIDHVGALAEVVAATRAQVVAHPAETADLPVLHVPVQDGDLIRVGACSLDVLHLVGHTLGSIALLYQEPRGRPHLFTGDSLFCGGIGTTWENPDNFCALMTDVENKVFNRLPDETWVYPGHGADTTLGAERPSLPSWWARGW